jgi:hypothetical protein
MKVKQLAWEHDSETDRYCATSIVGVYYRWGVNWRLGNGMVFQEETPEAASRACQADYDRIVRSALVPA